MNTSWLSHQETARLLERDDIGQIVYIQNPTESQSIRDADGDLVGSDSAIIPIHAFPIYLAPGQKQRDRAGMSEKINAIFWISAREFKNKIRKGPVDVIRWSIAMRDLGSGSERKTMRNYSIDQAHYKGTLANGAGFDYVVIGGIEDLSGR